MSVRWGSSLSFKPSARSASRVDTMPVFFIFLALHCFAFEMHEVAAHRSHVRDFGRVFLTNLYHKDAKNGGKTLDASEVIHAVQGKGMSC